MIGTEDRPIHASQLALLLRCPLRAVLSAIEASPSSRSADTGSAAHHIIASWHRGSDLETAIQKARDVSPSAFPLADLDQAEAYARAYTSDPRHPREIEVETPLKWNKDGVFFVGTADQLRPNALGRKAVWDLKTGELSGREMAAEYAAQIAAYAVMADADPGGIIRLRDYLLKPRAAGRKAAVALGMPVGVFYPVGFTRAQAEEMMLEAVRRVHDIRAGRLDFAPGAYCCHCPALHPGVCLGRRAALREMP